MITSQLISFKDSFIGTTMNAAQGITEVFTSTQLLILTCAIIAIASAVFGAYKLAMHLGYFSPKDLSQNEYRMPTAPPFEEDIPEYVFASPSAPPQELVLSESSPEMQEKLFKLFPGSFGHSP